MSLFLSLSFFINANVVYVAELDGVISPASSSYLIRTIDLAEQNQTECLIIKLDTPGGLDESMRETTKRILRAQIPIIVYVAPSGARAASAGVFILYASHIAAMAPGTNVGAAHPVSMGQEKMDSVMLEKVTNDAVAYLKALAKTRKRNLRWAEDAVRKSASIDAETAQHLGVCDIIAENEMRLLEKLNGKVVKIDHKEIILHTKGVPLRKVKMTLRERLLLLLTNPNIAYILLLLGIYGLFFELQNPGAIFPGVVGGISLILGFYALHLLPVNYAGVALIFLSAILFILDIYITSHGLLSIGGVISLVLGSLILFESDVPYLRISWEVIMMVIIIVVGFVVFLLTLGIRAQFNRKVSGREGLIGEFGVTKTAVGPKGGTVFVRGEFWNAISDRTIKKDQRIVVVGVEKMVLKVEPAQVE